MSGPSTGPCTKYARPSIVLVMWYCPGLIPRLGSPGPSDPLRLSTLMGVVAVQAAMRRVARALNSMTIIAMQ